MVDVQPDETLLDRLLDDLEQYSAFYAPALEPDLPSFEQGLLWAAQIAKLNPALLQQIAATGFMSAREYAYINEWTDVYSEADHD